MCAVKKIKQGIGNKSDKAGRVGVIMQMQLGDREASLSRQPTRRSQVCKQLSRVR